MYANPDYANKVFVCQYNMLQIALGHNLHTRLESDNALYYKTPSLNTTRTGHDHVEKRNNRDIAGCRAAYRLRRTKAP